MWRRRWCDDATQRKTALRSAVHIYVSMSCTQTHSRTLHCTAVERGVATAATGTEQLSDGPVRAIHAHTGTGPRRAPSAGEHVRHWFVCLRLFVGCRGGNGHSAPNSGTAGNL